jgi:hypothetical protein
MSSSSRRDRSFSFLAASGAGLVLAGAVAACASQKDPPPPTVVEVTSGSVAEALGGQSCQGLDIAAGGSTTYAILPSGAVYGWGENAVNDASSTHALGHDSQDESMPLDDVVLSPTYLGVANATLIAAGPEGACAVLKDTTVSCWGAQLGGSGWTTPQIVQDDVGPLKGAIGITYGVTHACAWKSDGTAWCWGGGQSGQLGDGNLSDSLTAVKMAAPFNDIVKVVAAGATTCVLRKANEVDCVGNNAAGQLGQGSTQDEPEAALSPPKSFTKATALFGGGNGTFCATESAVSPPQTKCWGYNGPYDITGDEDDAGILPAITSPIFISNVAGVAFAQGAYDACENVNGKLSCWGANGSGQVAPGNAQLVVTTKTPITLPPTAGAEIPDSVLKVVVGDKHMCALTSANLFCWGGDDSGQIGDGQPAGGTRTATNIPLMSYTLRCPAVKWPCGVVSDPCGHSIYCGSCGPSATCGKSNVCSGQPCPDGQIMCNGICRKVKDAMHCPPPFPTTPPVHLP